MGCDEGTADLRWTSTTPYGRSFKPPMENLPPHKRHILLLRFFANTTQPQIVQEVGISQMRISCLLPCTLTQLRE